MSIAVILKDIKEVLSLDLESDDFVIHLPEGVIVSTERFTPGNTYITLFKGWDNLSDKLGTVLYGTTLKHPSRFLYTGFKVNEAVVKGVRLLCQ